MIQEYNKIEAMALRIAGAGITNDDTPIRAPICCILGDTGSGKTTLLDSMSGTVPSSSSSSTLSNAATYFEEESIPDHPEYKIPGLLFIDTPGQPLITHPRIQAVALCDIAILVVDINIPLQLQPQTIESLLLLRKMKKKFIIALNHIDRLSEWKTAPDAPFRQSYDHQSPLAQINFSDRMRKIIPQFRRYGITADIYVNIKEIGGTTVSIVPTSALSGEGLSEIKSQLIKRYLKLIRYREQETLKCTVLDVELLQGRGTTINVVLVNGTLHVGDQIALCGTQGQIVTSIQALWTAPPQKKLGAETHYLCHKDIKGVKAVKIIAQGLEHAIAGTDLQVLKPGDDSKDNVGHEKD